jgi:hypothetical protein
VKPKKPSDAVQDVVQIVKTMEHATQGFGFLGMVNSSPSGVQYGTIDVDCDSLQRSVERSESDADTQLALGKVLLEMPDQIRDQSCRMQNSLKFIAQGNDKPGGDRLSVFPIEVVDQVAESALKSPPLGTGQVARTNHVGNDGDIALGSPIHLPSVSANAIVTHNWVIFK